MCKGLIITDSQNEYLSIIEKLMLLKIKCVGQKIIDDRESLKYEILTRLCKMGYIKEFESNKFPTRRDDFTNEICNAYKVSRKYGEYKFYSRSRFWDAAKSWIAIAISVIAIAIAFFK